MDDRELEARLNAIQKGIEYVITILEGEEPEEQEEKEEEEQKKQEKNKKIKYNEPEI